MHLTRLAMAAAAIGVAPACAMGVAVSYPAVPNSYPSGIAITSTGAIVTGNADNTVTQYTPAGALASSPWPVSIAPGQFPIRLAVGPGDTIVTANKQSDDASRIAPDGTVTPLSLGGGLTPPERPVAVVFDSRGNAYVANYTTSNVTRIAPDGTPTVLALAPSDSSPLTARPARLG